MVAPGCISCKLKDFSASAPAVPCPRLLPPASARDASRGTACRPTVARARPSGAALSPEDRQARPEAHCVQGYTAESARSALLWGFDMRGGVCDKSPRRL